MVIILNNINIKTYKNREIVMQLFLSTFIILILGFINKSSATEQRVIHVGEKAELFKQWSKVDGEYVLIKSAPVFQEVDSDVRSKGYYLPLSDVIKGQYKREIYDYDIQQSSINIFNQVRKSLKNNGYQEHYSCSTTDCGDISGWQLYITTLIGDVTEKQYFLSAERLINDTESEYVSFYVTEIDDRPRGVIDIISLPTRNKFDVVIKASQFLKRIEKDGRVTVDGLSFGLGTATLNHGSDKAIELMSTVLKQNPNFKFAIVGHSDNTGGFNKNIQLSTERAKMVKFELIKKYGVIENQLIARGVGSLSPMVSNTDEKGRAINRRVELVKL